MSLRSFLVAGHSADFAVDVSAEPAAGPAVSPTVATAPASKPAAAAAAPAAALVPALPIRENQHEEDGLSTERGDPANFPLNPSLKAYVFKHGHWRRSVDKRSALCPVPTCRMVVPCSGNTTNLDWHTRKHHNDLFEEQQRHKASLETPKAGTQLKFEPTSLTREALIGALAELVILDQQPFNIVDAPALENLVRVAANDASLGLPSRNTIHKRVCAMAIAAEENLRGQLQGKHPALTTDIWTSNSGVPFMAVTGHWIPEDNPELVSTTLSCVEFRGSHTAERLAEKITEVMGAYGITDTAVALTTDTAANIKKAGRKLLAQEWIPCTCHLLQLCALKILNQPSVKATFAKHNKLTNHLHSSTSSSEKLAAIQQAASKPRKKIPTHCATRWNSNYEQARVINEYKFCIQQLCDTLTTEGKLNIFYTDVDWANTRAVVELLELFCEATDMMQGENFITNSMMPMLASTLHAFCVTKACDLDLPQHIRDAADDMFDDVEDRFYPPTKCSMIAAVCDPRVKKLTWCNPSEKKSYREVTVDAMMAAVADERDSGRSKDPPADANQPAASPVRTDLRKKKPVDKQTLLFAKMVAVSAMIGEEEAPDLPPQSTEAILAERKTAAGYELERYLQGETLEAEASSQTVLRWWFDRRLVFPVLYKVACIYLAVPASSGSSERVFSAAGNIVTNKRNRLGAESVKNLVFLHGCHGVAWNMNDSNPRSKKRLRSST